MKTCTVCRVELPDTDFWKSWAQCKTCATARRNERRMADPERFKRYHRDWRKKHPGHHRTLRLRKYGLTQASFDALLLSQSNACAICNSKVPGGKGNWHIDHDHACCPEQEKSCGNCVRGLLCWPCNIGLSHFGDDPSILERASSYVRGELG